MIKIKILELSVAINYDVIVDDMKEDLLTGASILSYAKVPLKCDTHEVIRKGKVVKEWPESNEVNIGPEGLPFSQIR